MTLPLKLKAQKVAEIVRDAGGTVIGRTKLQKIGYLLEEAGYGDDFLYDYYHYGPYSEDVAEGAQYAVLFDFLNEEEKQTDWGGSYSIYTCTDTIPEDEKSSGRIQLITAANEARSVLLELAATALYLSKDGEADPWKATREKKPEKSQEGRLEEACCLYRKLRGTAPILPEL